MRSLSASFLGAGLAGVAVIALALAAGDVLPAGREEAHRAGGAGGWGGFVHGMMVLLIEVLFYFSFKVAAPPIVIFPLRLEVLAVVWVLCLGEQLLGQAAEITLVNVEH